MAVRGDYLRLTPEVKQLINQAGHQPLLDYIRIALGVSTDDAEAHDEKRWSLMSVDDLRARPQARFLLPEEKVLVAGTLNTLVGETMTYKSFLSLDWGLRVAREGRKVVFLLNEASEDFPGRFDAWREYHKVPVEELATVHVYDGDFNLVTDAHDIAIMCKDAELIVVDTLRRAIKGYAEDSADEVTDVVAACDHITRHTGAAILLVAHTGHENKHRIRGSSVWDQAAYHGVNLAKTETPGIIRMSNTKAKGSMWDPRNIKLLVTGDGEQEAVVIPVEHRFTGLKQLNARERHCALWAAKQRSTNPGSFLTPKWAGDVWGITPTAARKLLNDGKDSCYMLLSGGKRDEESKWLVLDPYQKDTSRASEPEASEEMANGAPPH